VVVSDDHASILHVYGDTELQKFWGHEFDLLRSRDVIGNVTIGHGVGTFLLVVNDDHASYLAQIWRYGALKIFGGHEFDLLGSRDVIGHVTIGLGMWFSIVVHWNHASILHRYGDIGPKDTGVTTLTFGIT